jgi:hypothetical protein
MPVRSEPRPKTVRWTPIPDPPDRFSTGIPEFDRLLSGGFPRGGMALFQFDETVTPSDRELLMTPTLLNFLGQSNGIMAVLPARESPHEFRSQLTRWVTRRLFDTRVRVVSYVGEDSQAPYVVELKIRGPRPITTKEKRDSALAIKRLAQAERAVRGARSRMYLELIAFEIMDMIAGSDTASRMFFFAIKRIRQVGNLCIGILRPGLGCADAVRGMADLEFAVHRDEVGLTVRGIRPPFASHRVLPDPRRGVPWVSFIPIPSEPGPA